MTDLDRQLAEAMGRSYWDCDSDGDIYCAVHAPIINPGRFKMVDGHCPYGTAFSPTRDANDCREVMQWWVAGGDDGNGTFRDKESLTTRTTARVTLAQYTHWEQVGSWEGRANSVEDGPTYDLIATCRAILAALEATNGEG